jgi:lipopolysaccharide/colanic/teichoic acid biosynthesis glycosyltransferase
MLDNYTLISYKDVKARGKSISSNRGEGVPMTVQSLSIHPNSLDSRYLQAKRILDVVFTLLILPILCLVSAILAIAIRLDSKGPVLFHQRRVGKNGAEFDMLKFRSMYVNSEENTHREAIKHYLRGQKLNDNTSTDLAYKQVADPRITRVGRFIRKTSLDELPQFWNVLRGDMSLVGPRPPVPYEVELYSSHDWLRLSGKPGLTGPWQVYGRSQVTFREMVEMDIAYLQHQSIWEDFNLIALTVLVMIWGKGGT